MTKNDTIALLKQEFPTIKIGSDETGYTQLDADEYEVMIAQWAYVELQKKADEEKVIAAQAARTSAVAKLEALGLTTDDLAALGL